LFTRKNPSVSLLRDAFRAQFRAGKHAARRVAQRKPRLTIAVASLAAAGVIAAVGGATVASAAGNTAAGSHATAFAGGSTAAHTKVDVAAEAAAGKHPESSPHAVKATTSPGRHAAPAKVTGTTKHAAVAKPAVKSKPAVHSKPKPAAKPKAAAKPKPKPKPKPKHAGPTKPYQIYDSVTPTAIPQGQHVATYANGPFQASWADVSGRGDVLWIDVYGNNTGANALDVEPGDATPAVAAAWVKAKLEKDPKSKPIVYTMRSWWPAVTDSMNGLPGWMHSHVRYWIADPTGYDHILPGADATQWYWGKSVDITTAKPGFWK
jgi:outer membrane biosynthesis protein TonB